MVKPPAHPPAWMMRLVSSVTAARARALPLRVAPVTMVIEATAMMLPTNVVEEAMVAELPTAQKMSQGWAPLIKLTREPAPVMSVLAAWKT